jgi:hypothetical protein
MRIFILVLLLITVQVQWQPNKVWVRDVGAA